MGWISNAIGRAIDAISPIPKLVEPMTGHEKVAADRANEINSLRVELVKVKDELRAAIEDAEAVDLQLAAEKRDNERLRKQAADVAILDAGLSRSYQDRAAEIERLKARLDAATNLTDLLNARVREAFGHAHAAYDALEDIRVPE